MMRIIKSLSSLGLSLVVLSSMFLYMEIQPLCAQILDDGPGEGVYEEDPYFEETSEPVTRDLAPLTAQPSPQRSNIDMEEVLSEVRQGRRSTSDGSRPDRDANESRRSDLSVFRTISALFAVLVLILFLYYVARRFSKSSPLLGSAGLARVAGRIYLTPRASLHFVRTGGRVLVVGVTPNQVGLVAEFDEGAFEFPAESIETTEPVPGRFAAFLAPLIGANPPASKLLSSGATQTDDDIGALRGDIQRLQEYLKETAQRDRESQQ